MSAAQFFAIFVLAVTTGLALTVLSWRAEQYLRDRYHRAGVAYTDAELAEIVAREEAAWDEWESILRAIDNTPHPEATPIFAETIVDNVRRQGGGAA